MHVHSSPGGMVIATARPDALASYLRAHAWIDAGDDVVSVAPAGDGNMNCTLRVISQQRRLIVKQGQPWVEKYPDIPAPADRTIVEGRFYEFASRHPALAQRMPRFVGLDAASKVLVVEDVPDAVDLTSLYEGAHLDAGQVDALLDFLGCLHATPLDDEWRARFANDAMRALNHEHVFRLPLAAEAALLARLDTITPGLAGIARALAADEPYATRVAALGREYLHGAPRALVHGDFFPGSWIADGDRLLVIDLEFGFAGAPEFDLGVMAAHMVLAGRGSETMPRIARAARASGADEALTAGFAGVEIMRRLIGVAQLSRLRRTLDEKRALLDTSRRLVLGHERLAAR